MFFERGIMRRGRLRPSWVSLLKYVCIGGLVFCIDVAAFQMLLRFNFSPFLAVTVAYVLGIVAHFWLNKVFNFKAFNRRTLEQLGIYTVVAFCCWVMTVLVIEIGVRGLGMSAFWARIVAIAINIPTGFLGHRYLTFGRGITAVLSQWSAGKIRMR